MAGVEDVGARFEDVVTYHDSCHALRELKIKDGPRRLLANVRGLELREMDAAEECCGFGGTFSVKFAEVSGGMARTKIDSIVRTGASTVVSRDSSCLMQMQGALSRAGLPIRTMHLAEVLASPLTYVRRLRREDPRHAGRFQAAARHLYGHRTPDGKARAKRVAPDACPDYQELRTQANAVKRHTIEHLDYYLEEFDAQRRGARRQGGLLQGRRRRSPISCWRWPRSAARS